MNEIRISLAAARVNARMTQQQVAEKMGVYWYFYFSFIRFSFHWSLLSYQVLLFVEYEGKKIYSSGILYNLLIIQISGMPGTTKEEADKMAEVLHWFYRNHREEIDIMVRMQTAKENKRDMVLAVVVLGLICVAIIALAIYLRFFI